MSYESDFMLDFGREQGQCYHCGRSTRGNTGQCYDCRQTPERGIKPEDVGWYASGWLWDDEFPELQHRALYTFGPMSKTQALSVLDNLSGPTDYPDDQWLKPHVWEVTAEQVTR